MDNVGLISNIKSSYILKDIFNYIQDKTFKYKLFLYSKKMQKKYDINFVEIKEKYLKKIGFDIDEYLYIKPELFKKDYLTNEYYKFLNKKNINKEQIESIIYNIFQNKKIKDIDEEDIDKIENYEKLINIDSPLFNIISKTKNFEKIFTIHISQKNIDKYNLKIDYINFFNNLNKINIKYESIFYVLNDINKLNYLKEINIDFK